MNSTINDQEKITTLIGKAESEETRTTGIEYWQK